MNDTVRGNLMGVCALLMWCTLIGLIRSVTEAFGTAAGTALIYTVGALVNYIKNGPPRLRQMPKSYLFGAGALFIGLEIFYSQGIGLAQNPQQTMEVGMLNYLWPCLTVVFSIWILKKKLRWWIWPGTALAILGLYWCVSANGNLNLAGFAANLRATPLPYMLGAAAGVSWALYSNLSVRCSKNCNAISVFFTAIAIILWTSFFINGGELRWPGLWPVVQLLYVGLILGFSYSFWESGIHHGNFLLLAVCSYFTPAGAMLFASFWLNSMPPAGYWAGVGLVVAGSVVCWLASIKTRTPAKVPVA